MTPITLRPGIREKCPGDEPVPGYRLLRPLGSGGFGEVWKCEAPGGLPKAIKFVPTGGDQFRQEMDAVQQIKTIRHPFLLTLERVEEVGGELVMVMELADGQLQDRFRSCRANGLPGLPRDELLGYMREAAEALDMIGSRFGLQHLDVKPENLFLVAGHLKVGDYGLVRRTQLSNAGGDSGRGFTPRYTAPEVLRGYVDPRSDQYSLALVYAELLTGTFPYPGQSAQQIILQHVGSPPDLSPLAPGDRAVVGRALAKHPADRFPSCTEFVRALGAVADYVPAPPDPPARSAELPSETERDPAAHQSDTPTLPTRRKTPTSIPPEPAAAAPPSGIFGDAAEAPSRDAGQSRAVRRPSPRRAESAQRADPFKSLRAVMWVDQFNRPEDAEAPPDMSGGEFVDAVLLSSLEDGRYDPAAGGEPDEAQVSHFLSSIPAAMVPFKLALVAERWGMAVGQPDPFRIVLRREGPVEPRKPGKNSPPPPPPGVFEVTLRRPAPPSAEYHAFGEIDAAPTDPFACQALADLPQVLADIRGQLQNLAERRAYPRYGISLPVRAYPLYQDGVVGAPVAGSTVDISAGGIRFRTTEAIRTTRLYVEFTDVPSVVGRAVHVHVIRTLQEPGGRTAVTVGRFSGGR